MKLSTSIGDIDIEYQFCLRFKNHDFLNHVLTFDFSIFQKTRVTGIQIGCKSRQISFP